MDEDQVQQMGPQDVEEQAVQLEGSVEPEEPSSESGSASSSAGDAAQKQKRRRWGAETNAGKEVLRAASAETEQTGEEPSGKRSRKSRWDEKGEEETVSIPGLPGFTLPAHLAHLIDVDPETVELQKQLAAVTQKLALAQAGRIDDERPRGERSPSPEPVYNEAGVRINMREQRAKDRLVHQRMELISELIKRNPNYKPPPDYRPPKKTRKIFLPQPAPGRSTNYMGLIIGPRGHTQQRMEAETHTRIMVRGRGSGKGSSRPDVGGLEDDDLHVFISGDRDEDVDKAVEMINALLSSGEEGLEEHKRTQLRELAVLNGTLRDADQVVYRSDSGAGATHEPYRLPSDVQTKVDQQYRRDVAAVHGEAVAASELEYSSFLAELGGQLPTYEALISMLERQRTYTQASSSDAEACTVYVGYIAQEVTEPHLAHLFHSVGDVMDCKLVYDRNTGVSRGFAFIRFASEAQAAAAIETFNQYPLAGRRLAVRPKGKQPDKHAGAVGPSEPIKLSGLPRGILYCDVLPPGLEMELVYAFMHVPPNAFVVPEHLKPHLKHIERLINLQGALERGAYVPEQELQGHGPEEEQQYSYAGLAEPPTTLIGPPVALAPPPAGCHSWPPPDDRVSLPGEAAAYAYYSSYGVYPGYTDNAYAIPDGTAAAGRQQQQDTSEAAAAAAAAAAGEDATAAVGTPSHTGADASEPERPVMVVPAAKKPAYKEPKTVQVVSLDPQELDRARKRAQAAEAARREKEKADAERRAEAKAAAAAAAAFLETAASSIGLQGPGENGPSRMTHGSEEGAGPGPRSGAHPPPPPRRPASPSPDPGFRGRGVAPSYQRGRSPLPGYGPPRGRPYSRSPSPPYGGGGGRGRGRGRGGPRRDALSHRGRSASYSRSRSCSRSRSFSRSPPPRGQQGGPGRPGAAGGVISGARVPAGMQPPLLPLPPHRPQVPESPADSEEGEVSDGMGAAPAGHQQAAAEPRDSMHEPGEDAGRGPGSRRISEDGPGSVLGTDRGMGSARGRAARRRRVSHDSSDGDERRRPSRSASRDTPGRAGPGPGSRAQRRRRSSRGDSRYSDSEPEDGYRNGPGRVSAGRGSSGRHKGPGYYEGEGEGGRPSRRRHRDDRGRDERGYYEDENGYGRGYDERDRRHQEEQDYYGPPSFRGGHGGQYLDGGTEGYYDGGRGGYGSGGPRGRGRGRGGRGRGGRGGRFNQQPQYNEYEEYNQYNEYGPQFFANPMAASFGFGFNPAAFFGGEGYYEEGYGGEEEGYYEEEGGYEGEGYVAPQQAHHQGPLSGPRTQAPIHSGLPSGQRGPGQSGPPTSDAAGAAAAGYVPGRRYGGAGAGGGRGPGFSGQ